MLLKSFLLFQDFGEAVHFPKGLLRSKQSLTLIYTGCVIIVRFPEYLLTFCVLLYTLYYNIIRRCLMTTAISVRLSKELAEQLDNIAKETERSRSYIIQKSLESYIEDYADLQIALDRLHDKTDTVISGKEVRKILDL